MYLFNRFIPSDRLIRIIVLTSLFLVLSAIARDVLDGGNEWRQGDWLINNLTQPIRRGVFGGWILALSDLSGLSPVLVTGLIQATCFIAIGWAFLRWVEEDMPTPETLLLLTSPAMIFLFWAGDVNGSMRKEILGYLGVLLAGLSVFHARLAPLIAGGVIISLGAWGHLVNAMLFPLFGFIVLWGAYLHRQWLPYLAVLGATGGAIIAAVLYTLAFPMVENISLVCDPLLKRGLTPIICSGAIEYLTRNAGDGIKDVLHWHGGLNDIASFALTVALSFAAIAVFYRHVSIPRWLLLSCGLSILVIVPLYMVALDWGRFLSLQVFSVTTLLLIGLRIGVIIPIRPLTPPIIKLLLVIGLFLSLDHVKSIEILGLIPSTFYVLGLPHG